MFKKILCAFVGSLAAIWLSVGLLFIFSLLFVVSLVGLVGASEGGVNVEKHSILYLDLTGEIAEREESRPIQDIIMDQGASAQYLNNILNGIKLASGDKNIDGIYINCGGSALGYAGREELINALQEFKKSGKWVYAYADSYTQGDYYVASCADKIYLNPVGNVDVRGIAAQIPFFKEALDKLGVEMQIVKVGTFKSAVEPFIRNEPSEPSILQTKVYIDAIWKNVSGTISKNRAVTPATVNVWADTIIATVPAKDLVKQKVITEPKYRRQVEDILRELTDVDKDDDLKFVDIADYVTSNPKVKLDELEGKFEEKGHFAVLYAVGDIVDEGSEGISGEEMTPLIVELADDEDVKGLVMRVNSGGGSAFASEQIWEALEYFKSKGKPFYVSMGDYAASGGYYISCGADVIYADKNTITGSIGIFGMIPCIKPLLNDKLGIHVADISTNKNSAFLSITNPMTEQQYMAMQKHVEDGYKLFTGRVAKSRKLPVDSVLKIAEGRVWPGEIALDIKLVDKIGGINDAILAMAKKLKMKPDNYVTYPRLNLSALEKIIMSGGVEANVGTLPVNVVDNETTQKAVKLLKSLQNQTPAQARMEMIELH